ncbi:MAG: hypothetical protein O3B21_14655 [Proteobacteria bacterium]|nr:hypothetical protein [Pseudomonadota bacterium]MDA1354952.1 hypothetical protein [Pseudomonadota bacterium]
MQAMAHTDERRDHQRELDPTKQLSILIDGETISTENWSLGGFRSYGLFQYDKKDHFTGVVVGSGTRPDIPFVGKVLRVDEDGARVVKMAEIKLDHLLLLEAPISG